MDLVFLNIFLQSSMASEIEELTLQVSSILMSKESKIRERGNLMVRYVFLLENGDDTF